MGASLTGKHSRSKPNSGLVNRSSRAVDKKRPWFTAKAQRTQRFSFSALSVPPRLTFPHCIRFGLRSGERVMPASHFLNRPVARHNQEEPLGTLHFAL